MGHNGAVLCHSILMSFIRVAGWSTDPRVLGRHSLVSKHRYAIT